MHKMLVGVLLVPDTSHKKMYLYTKNKFYFEDRKY